MVNSTRTSIAASVDPLAAQEPSRGRRLIPRLIQNRVVAFWIVVLFILAAAALFAPIVAPDNPVAQSGNLLSSPSRHHLFGTDDLGRDVLSRVIYGGRISLTIGFIAVTISTVFGTTIGLVSGYASGLTDSVVMRLVDLLMAFPGIILAILIMATLGPSIVNVMIAVGISAIPWYARTVRGTTLAIREFDYVLAARAAGASSSRIIQRHVLPNVLASVIVLATVGIAGAILEISSLSFIGLGAQPPSPEWGAMLSEAQTYLRQAWWMATFPGVAIMLSVFAINLIGDGLRDVLDPRLRGTLKQ